MNVSEQLDLLNKYIREIVADHPMTMENIASEEMTLVSHFVNVGAKVREIKRFIDAPKS